MSLLRFDPTSKDWVIFAPERRARPDQFARTSKPESATTRDSCPFCPGNEHLTPDEVLRIDDGHGGWRLRVVPNKFPALRIDDDCHRAEESGLFRHMGGCGAHEVIIESPEHDRFLGHQPVEQVRLLLQVMQARYKALLADRRIFAVIIFKNHGERAGTSLRHPHCQIIATPVVPRLHRLKHAIATDYFDLTGKCLYCELLAAELAHGKRLVVENDRFAAVAPFASRSPFEIRILPKTHRPSFGRVPEDELGPLAAILKDVLNRLHKGLNNPDFNLTIQTTPRGEEEKEYFLWHIDIVPRLTQPAGFELGSGMAINVMMPEDAAAFLRGIDGEDHD